MSDKRKGKKRREETSSDKEKPSKEEYDIAGWLRKNIPIKKTKFLNHNVEYFTAVKAVDALMESHWAVPKEGEEALFSSRAHVVDFLNKMLRHKFFHRARKVPVSEQELKAKQKKKEKKKDTAEEKHSKKDEEGDNSHPEGDKEKKDKEDKNQGDDKEKKKRKIRLEMHLEQCFVDGLDAYVWIYEPIPVYYWFFGTLLVLGAIAVCLFPLWPPTVRKGVYYLSVAAAGFLIFIIALAVLRVLVFCFLWILTLGKHHLWLFPNLTEDVGFLASFWPLYQYEYKGTKDIDKKSKKKEKDSDNEDENPDDKDQESIKEEVAEPAATEIIQEKSADTENSESESESGSQKSQTGKDFEMVDREEVES